MPVALMRIKEAVEVFRQPSLPQRPRLPSASVAHGRVGGSATFLLGALVAFLWANTTAAPVYTALRDATVSVGVGPARLSVDVRTFVNDGLMALFFFSIALAARRQVPSRAVTGRSALLIPCAAAVGALLVPALIFSLVAGAPGLRLAVLVGGFDIGLGLAAFAVAHLRPSPGRHPLFPFSAALDTGWIAALLLLGTVAFSWTATAICAVVYGAAFGSRWLGARGAAWGLISGAAVWMAWRRTGLPPAVAGAFIAMLVPEKCAADERKATALAEDALDDFDRAMDDSDGDRTSALARRLGDIAVSVESPLDRWQTGLLPWLTWLVLPLFGLMNGGISIAGLPSMTPALLLVAALAAGRPLGILLFAAVARRRAAADSAESPGTDGVVAPAVLACAGGVPAIAGAAIAFRMAPAADPYLLALLGLSIVATVGGGLGLRRGGRPRS